MAEILSLRSENSKTFDLGGGKRRLESHIGAIHYKDNYADPNEVWKDIDLTWEGNRITKAPYELTREDNKLTFKDKKTGDVSTLERISVFPLGIQYEIVTELSAVKFRHILPSDKVPFEAQFRIGSIAPIGTTPRILSRAFDDEGELELEVSLVGDILTEKLSRVKDKQTGRVRPAKGIIRVDPTWQVGSSWDDVTRISDSLQNVNEIYIGYAADAWIQMGSGMRFTNITIPQGSIINQSYLTLTAQASLSNTVVNSRISAEDVDDAITFANDAAAFDTRWAARTTARVDWDSIPAWTANTEYNSPEIKTVIQEIVDRGGWASGNDLVIFWEDFDLRGDQEANHHRNAYSYDGSTTKAPKLIIVYDTTIIPTTLALILTFYAPTVTIATTVIPTTLALTLTTYTPEIWTRTYKVECDWNNDGDFTDTYDDITADIKSIHFSRGKSDELGKAEVGQCSIIVNNADAKYTPGAGGVISASLLPKRPIRIRAILSSVIYNLFYGFIEEIIPHPHLSEQDCIITAIDGLDFLSRHDMATALYKDALTGTIHGYILDDAGWSATMRTLDTGQLTVPYWYGQDVKARFAQEEIDDSEQGFSYVNGAGYFCFEDRHHRSTATHQTSQGTFDNTMANITYSLNPRNVYNIIKVTVTPWEEQLEAELWRLEETPSIPVGGTYTVWGEASVSGKSVFVDAWTTLNSGDTDYTISGTFTIAQTNFAKSIKIVVTNTGTTPNVISLLKARGTYWDDQTKVTRKAEDSTSQTAYQKRTLTTDGKYMTDADTAQSFCSYAIGKFKDPRAELSMTIMNKNVTMLTQLLSREISDRITIVNTKLGVSADYFIDYMEHDISLGSKLHTATYRLADCINEDFWCLGYSKLGTQTKLGF